MNRLPNREFRGFISLLPLLIITLMVVSGFAIYNQNKNLSVIPKSVLSESDSKDNNEVIGKNENSGTTGTSKPKETPDHKETLEPKDTPEPKETPDTEEFEEETEFEIKEGTSESKIKIRSGKNKFEFQQEGSKFSVESNFPLSVNPTTRELTVTTPSGSKVVAILPQEAVDKMLAEGMVTSTTGVHLKTEDDGSLTYNVEGTKKEKLLGVINISVSKSLIVSAETGQILSVNQSTFSKILDFLSI
jgi:uncharacterized membrane protein YkoI